MQRSYSAALFGWLLWSSCAGAHAHGRPTGRSDTACDGTGEIRGVVHERGAQTPAESVGTPVEGVTVVAVGPRSHVVTTARDGSYRIRGLVPDVYAVQFRARDQVRDRRQVHVSACKVTPIYMTMPPADPGPLFELVSDAR